MSELTVLTKYEQYINEPEKTQDQAKQEKDSIPYVLGSLKRIGAVKDGPVIAAAWNKDSGTKERRLMISLVYPDGEVTPVHEYKQGKLKMDGAKVLKDLADLDGINPKILEQLSERIWNCADDLDIQEGSEGKCSLRHAYNELCAYVSEYEEQGKVFVKAGYGFIHSKYLPEVLKRLDVGYSRLEIEKNFKVWGLLQVSEGSGHPYSLAVKIGGRTEWFMSFRLAKEAAA